MKEKVKMSYNEKRKRISAPSQIEKLENYAENLKRMIAINERFIEARSIALGEMKNDYKNVIDRIRFLKILKCEIVDDNQNVK